MGIDMTAGVTAARGESRSAGVEVLKKSLDIEAQNALLLLESIAQAVTPAAHLPPNLGQNINTTA
jgi:hypothetical protein